MIIDKIWVQMYVKYLCSYLTHINYFYRASDCSDDGELSDHDLTPCNPSPSFPLHGWAALGGAGRGNGTCVDHDDIEEDWRNHVQNVTNDPTNDMLLSTFVAFGKLFNVSYYDK